MRLTEQQMLRQRAGERQEETEVRSQGDPPTVCLTVSCRLHTHGQTAVHSSSLSPVGSGKFIQALFKCH